MPVALFIWGETILQVSQSLALEDLLTSNNNCKALGSQFDRITKVASIEVSNGLPPAC